MSGGSFNYGYAELLNTYQGEMMDPVMEAMLVDFAKVLHDLEWYASADIGEESYRRSVERFKSKWIGNPSPILENVILEEMQRMQRRLLTALYWRNGGDGK